MKYEERARIINMIISVVKNEPSIYADIINACNEGQKQHIEELKQQTIDMETIAVAFASTMEGKYREKNQEWINNLLYSKLSRHQGKTAFMNWESTLNDLEKLKNKGENQ